jgi:hypothetical protein
VTDKMMELKKALEPDFGIFAQQVAAPGSQSLPSFLKKS